MTEEAKCAQALMIIIERTIDTYQGEHPGDVKEEIFILFENATQVHYTKTHDKPREAINDISSH